MSSVNSHGASGKSQTVRPAPSMACSSPTRMPWTRSRIDSRVAKSAMGARAHLQRGRRAGLGGGGGRRWAGRGGGGGRGEGGGAWRAGGRAGGGGGGAGPRGPAGRVGGGGGGAARPRPARRCFPCVG